MTGTIPIVNFPKRLAYETPDPDYNHNPLTGIAGNF